MVIYILMNYFEQFVISVVVFKHVHWAKLSVCHFADGGLSTSAFPDKITTVVNVILKLSRPGLLPTQGY